jgi:hypothetical protein
MSDDEQPLENRRRSTKGVSEGLTLGNKKSSGVDMASDINKKFLSFANFEIAPTKRIGTFWEYISPFSANSTEANPNVIRTHGTLGWTYMFSVPLKKEHELLTRYMRAAFQRDEDVCLAQSVTRPYFIFFMDYDYKSSKPIENFEYALAACTFVARCYSKFFPSLLNSKEITYPDEDGDYLDKELAEWTGAGEGFGRLSSVVASSGVKKGKNKKGDDEWTMGVHHYFIGRNLVNTQQAISMAMYMQKELESSTYTDNQGVERSFSRDESKGLNSWANVIDIGVYKGNGGARMLGSCKIAACPTCKGSGTNIPKGGNDVLWSKEKEDKEFDKYFKSNIMNKKTTKSDLNKCSECLGKKRIIQKRAYMPLVVLNGHGLICEQMMWLVDNPSQFVYACSIRTARVEPDVEWVLPEGATLFDADVEVEKEHTILKGPIVTDEDTDECAKGGYIASDSQTAQHILALIRSMDDHFAELNIKPIKRTSEHSYEVFMKPDYARELHRYCLNKRGVHGNRVCFIITPSGMYQKCYSPNKECENWWKKQPKTPIPWGLHELLFGKTKLPASVQRKPVIYNPPVPEASRNNPQLCQRSEENIKTMSFIKFVMCERLKVMPSTETENKAAWKEEMLKVSKMTLSSIDRQFEAATKKRKTKNDLEDEEEEMEDDKEEDYIPYKKPSETQLYAERTGKADNLLDDEEDPETEYKRMMTSNSKKKKKKNNNKPTEVTHGGMVYSSTSFVNAL